ncbi:two component transcriptional regulator, LuxR family (plasmid) [Emticicia oligotrophica DSM 17448]|uniref:Two component transcriptional regulator, LuxR family n=1 Tax=Emticicia oligotrophica (strain DSM 17448 / CIP 109782 / MTCC 6937 / GPTSA100-15) TaxID=929562 RepID=A0ABM5N8G1_EMTOG|nr:response regulator transcription factor [Emticicia oligotrophica]AFK05747.1 two component transcriptional regulator, LuxR family [Emticicia oligotrophica DSM 17448]
MINIILIDDHIIFGEGITNLLSLNQNFNFIGFYSKTEGLDEIFENNRIDVVLLDVSVIPINGIDYCKYIKTKFHNPKVLFFTMHFDDLIIGRAMKAGANGFITKNNTKDVLFEGIEQIMNGNIFYSPDVEKILLKQYKHEEMKGLPILSSREKEVLELIILGKTSHEIADKLFISTKTVEFHRSNLLIKFDAKNVVDLTREAIKMGIVKINN